MELRIEVEKLGEEIAKEVITILKPFLAKVPNQRESDDEIMGVQDLAQYLGVKRDTIYKKVSLHEIPFFKIGDLTKFKRSHIDRWIESQTRKPVPSLKGFKKKIAGQLIESQ